MITSPLMSNGTPNNLVVDSNLADILTLGDRQDASILYSDPMAPSIDQPI